MNYDYDFYLKVIFVGLIIILGVVGNLMLGGTILLSQRLRSKSINLFILNLSLSNVLQLVISAPLVTIDNLTEFYELGEVGCKSKLVIQNLFFIVPMLSVLAISIDRFIAIRYPFRDLQYRCKAITICLVIWIIGIAVSSVEFYSQVLLNPFERGTILQALMSKTEEIS